MPLPITRQPTRRRPPSQPPNPPNVRSAALHTLFPTLHVHSSQTTTSLFNGQEPEEACPPSSLVISRISLAISRTSVIPAPLCKRRPSHPENRQLSCRSPLRQFA